MESIIDFFFFLLAQLVNSILFLISPLLTYFRNFFLCICFYVSNLYIFFFFFLGFFFYLSVLVGMFCPTEKFDFLDEKT